MKIPINILLFVIFLFFWQKDYFLARELAIWLCFFVILHTVAVLVISAVANNLHSTGTGHGGDATVFTEDLQFNVK